MSSIQGDSSSDKDVREIRERFARFLLLAAECAEEIELELPGLATQAHEALGVAGSQTDRETVSTESFRSEHHS